MHDLLRRLSQVRPNTAQRFGLPLLIVGVMTLLRLVAPLDVAPFLLYMPVLFLMTLALGRGAEIVCLAVSTVAAAYFFVRGDDVGPCRPGRSSRSPNTSWWAGS